jgi:hypothetical protein
MPRVRGCVIGVSQNERIKRGNAFATRVRGRTPDLRSLRRGYAMTGRTARIAGQVEEGVAEELRLTVEASPTCKHIDRRLADFSFAVSASHDAAKAENSIPLTLGLSFDRRGWQVLLQEMPGVLTVGIKQADLQLFYERQSAKIEVFPLAHAGGGDGNFRGDVDGLSPWLVISIAAGDLPWLAGERPSNGGRDCICHGFHAGDIIRAVMTARASDCVVRIEGTVFDELSAAKILLIKHLAKLCILQNAEAMLCEQILTVVNRA